jgi:hypothetical protein
LPRLERHEEGRGFDVMSNVVTSWAIPLKRSVASVPQRVTGWWSVAFVRLPLLMGKIFNPARRPEKPILTAPKMPSQLELGYQQGAATLPGATLVLMRPLVPVVRAPAPALQAQHAQGRT